LDVYFFNKNCFVLKKKTLGVKEKCLPVCQFFSVINRSLLRGLFCTSHGETFSQSSWAPFVVEARIELSTFRPVNLTLYQLCYPALNHLISFSRVSKRVCGNASVWWHVCVSVYVCVCVQFVTHQKENTMILFFLPLNVYFTTRIEHFTVKALESHKNHMYYGSNIINTNGLTITSKHMKNEQQSI
jgi:hypothetical protein